MVTEAGAYSVDSCNDAAETRALAIVSDLVNLRRSGHWAFGIALVPPHQSTHPKTRVIIACAER